MPVLIKSSPIFPIFLRGFLLYSWWGLVSKTLTYSFLQYTLTYQSKSPVPLRMGLLCAGGVFRMGTAIAKSSMTTGKPLPMILRFSLPIFAGQLLQQLYNMADTMIVGHFLGVDALAAVGSTWALNYLIVYFCTGTCYGVGIPVAQQFGAGNMQRLRQCFMNAVYLTICLAAVLTVGTVIFCRPMQVITQTPEGILDLAYAYLVIIFAGLPCTFLCNFCFGILMALGDSKIPSLFMAASTILNLVLDLFLILVVHMGVAGAALATVLAQLVSGIGSLIYMLRRYPMLKPSREECKPNLSTILCVAGMGIPMGLQYSITAIGAVMLQSSINALGELAVAGFSAAYKIKGLFLCPIQAIGTALSTYAGQNYGAGNRARIRQGVRQTLLAGGVYAVAVLVILLLACRPLSMIFVDAGEAQVINYSAQLLRWLSFCYFELAVLLPVRYAVQGMGRGALSLCSGMAEMLARVVFAIWLIPAYGYPAVCISESMTFLAGILVIVPIYLILIRRFEKKQRHPKE